MVHCPMGSLKEIVEGILGQTDGTEKFKAAPNSLGLTSGRVSTCGEVELKGIHPCWWGEGKAWNLFFMQMLYIISYIYTYTYVSMCFILIEMLDDKENYKETVSIHNPTK